MILGLYPDNTEGAVLYNGVSQRRIDRYALRRCRVGITEQEPPIVGGGTILDNLTLLSDDFEADKLNRMLAILGLDKMIAAAENGAAAMLGSKKGGVSGGEKQNIAIVRQMLKSPDVMLFLESTSALDAKSRSALIKLLHEVKRDHIVIVVTHDEEMLAACDEVIPMPDAYRDVALKARRSKWRGCWVSPYAYDVGFLIFIVLQRRLCNTFPLGGPFCP